MRQLLCMILLMVILFMTSCGIRKDEPMEEIQTATVAATEAPSETEKYTFAESDIQAAKDAIMEKFSGSFQNCQMLRLEYIEGKYLNDYVDFAKRTGVDRVIVLESDFVTGPNPSPSLNPNHTYQNWKWILVDDGTGWNVRSNGYG